MAMGLILAIYDISCELNPNPIFFSTLELSVFQF